MEGTTRHPGRDRCRRLFVLVTTVTALLAAGAFQSPARALIYTALWNQASPSGYPVGAAIFDSANLSYGVNPTGTITFRLYGPSDPTCAAAPILTSSKAVQGNGYYTSASYITNIVGTYRWTAAYSGDIANSPAGPTACGDASAAVMVAKRAPTLSGSATLAALTGPLSDTATLNGGGPAGPTGTVTFSLYGPDNLTCSGSPVFTTTRTSTGSGQYHSDAFTPTRPGSYQWVLNYGGDANNTAASTICSDAANAVVVSGGVTATLSVTPGSASPGSALTVSWAGIARPTSSDWVALYAAGAPDSAVRTWRYTTGAASGSVTLTVPFGTAAGAYEVRLFANNSTVRLAKGSLTVT